jgi:hypothetical protein
MTRLRRLGAFGLVVGLGLGTVSGCTSSTPSPGGDTKVPLGSYQLVAFDTCDEALQGLRAAAKVAVGPYGFGGMAIEGAAAMSGGITKRQAPPVPQAASADKASSAGQGAGAEQANSYSGTNTHEAGVDEPDLVKTDGRRIVTVSGGTLRVVNAAGHSLAGSVEIPGTGVTNKIAYGYQASDLLLSGDHALVLVQPNYPVMSDVAVGPSTDVAGGANASNKPATPQPLIGPRLVLVSLNGQPRVLSSLAIEGSLVDARQVGSMARVVIRSNPRFTFPVIDNVTDPQRIQANREIIDQAGIDRWLPRIETTNGATTEHPQIDCGAVSRPSIYSGANLLTVLSIDLAKSTVGDGSPTTLVADGDTVYSNGPSLYVASDRRGWNSPIIEGDTVKPAQATTEIYKFDTSTPDRPTFVAGGSVPGYLLNQYAMSEWDDKLRVATTSNPDATQQTPSQSGIYVLAQKNKSLTQIGSVEGLGKGERIFAVRFVGTVGYVVTFRQTDPLYTVDIKDPTKPTVRGELKIPGYSAYLHPVDSGRLLGIGREDGGTQVSLFDVTNLADPKRIAQYKLPGSYSEAEFDPHAFLYWPATGMLVVPLQVSKTSPTARSMPTVGALVLRASGNAITEVGFLRQPATTERGGYPPAIRRSLVIDQTLWTVSDAGLMASGMSTLGQEAWLPL